MSTYHKVKQGEYLLQIAQLYGFSDYRTIWDHPKNSELKQKRQNPNILFPGDKIYIPDKEIKEEQCDTEQRHVFRAYSHPCVLRILAKDIDGEPIANTECTLQVEKEIYNLTTDSKGIVEKQIPNTARQGRLKIRNVDVPIKIGYLDPVETASGQQARLNNLGYYAGPLGETDEGMLKSTIEEFQCDHDLRVNGLCDPTTQGVLKEEHGC